MLSWPLNTLLLFLLFTALQSEASGNKADCLANTLHSLLHEKKHWLMKDIIAARRNFDSKLKDAQRHLGGRPFSHKEKSIIFRAHLVGFGEIGKDGKSLSAIGNYNLKHIREKYQLLKSINLTSKEIRMLMKHKIVGFKEGELNDLLGALSKFQTNDIPLELEHIDLARNIFKNNPSSSRQDLVDLIIRKIGDDEIDAPGASFVIDYLEFEKTGNYFAFGKIEKPSELKISDKYSKKTGMYLETYLGGGYKLINGFLREGKSIDELGISEIIIDLNKQPPYKGDVFRVASLPLEEIKKLKTLVGKDKEYVERAFTSTTRDLSISMDFARAYGGGNVLFKIKSLNGRYMDHLSSAIGEEEVLFPPQTKFKVVNFIEKDGNHYITLEQLTK